MSQNDESTPPQPEKQPLDFYNRYTCNAMIDQLLEKACAKHERLLRKRNEWHMDDEMKDEIRIGANQLLRDWIHHASLFAMHRSQCDNKEQLKRRKVELLEEDLDLAWRSLQNA